MREFKGKTYIDIREYYVDKSTMDTKPGKKGISLTCEQYQKLKSIIDEIDHALPWVVIGVLIPYSGTTNITGIMSNNWCTSTLCFVRSPYPWWNKFKLPFLFTPISEKLVDSFIIHSECFNILNFYMIFFPNPIGAAVCNILKCISDINERHSSSHENKTGNYQNWMRYVTVNITPPSINRKLNYIV